MGAGAIAMRAQVGKRAGAIMEELEDKRILEKEKRKALEAQALDDAMSGMSPQGERPGQRGRGIARPTQAPSYNRSQSRSGSRSRSSNGFGKDNSRRSKLAKWFSCFKTPRSALSHPPEEKNTSCTTRNGTTKRLRRLWK